MHFSHLEFWWLTLLLPLIAAALWYGHRLRLQARRIYGDERLLAQFKQGHQLRHQWLYPAGTFVVASLLTLCALGPIANVTRKRVPDGNKQIVAVIDVSKSMRAEDYR